LQAPSSAQDVNVDTNNQTPRQCLERIYMEFSISGRRGLITDYQAEAEVEFYPTAYQSNDTLSDAISLRIAQVVAKCVAELN